MKKRKTFFTFSQIFEEEGHFQRKKMFLHFFTQYFLVTGVSKVLQEIKANQFQEKRSCMS